MNGIDVINDLLAAEQSSIAPRLIESTTYVTPRWARADMVVRKMAVACRENCAALTDLVLDLGGAPQPRRYQTQTADIHFLELGSMLPQLCEGQRALVQKYAENAPLLTNVPHAARLVNQILNRHREHLRYIEEVSEEGQVRRAV